MSNTHYPWWQFWHWAEEARVELAAMSAAIGIPSVVAMYRRWKSKARRQAESGSWDNKGRIKKDRKKKRW
jgi:hypothetical protein